jgi:cytochrome c biogenesis factor
VTSLNTKALGGFVTVAVFLGNALVLVRRRRRSGEVRDYGHPIKDEILLLGSAILVVIAMCIVLWWLGPRAPSLRTLSGQVLILIFLLFAAGVSYVANMLGRSRE